MLVPGLSCTNMVPRASPPSSAAGVRMFASSAKTPDITFTSAKKKKSRVHSSNGAI